MKKLIIYIAVTTGVLWLCDYYLAEVQIDSVTTAVIAALVIGLLNTFVRPILHILAIPITLLTFGIFALIINIAMIALAAYLVPGFTVTGFIPAAITFLGLTVSQTVAKSLFD